MTELTQWIDPDGAIYTLDVDWSVAGRFMPTIVFESDTVPRQPGAVFRYANHGTREFLCPFDVTGVSEADLRTKVRQMIAAMDPTRGTGKIRVTSPVGDQREINCHVASGLDLQETLGDISGPAWQRFPATFLAHDPYWYDTNATTQSFTTSTGALFFPIFPLKITASEIAVDATVDNTGDVDAWPIWTVTGPGSVIKLWNLTSSRYIYFPVTLAAGSSITVDTRPGVKSATYDDGTNAYPDMNELSSLWPLQRGVNTIRLEMSGVTAASALTLVYARRYLSP